MARKKQKPTSKIERIWKDVAALTPRDLADAIATELAQHIEVVREKIMATEEEIKGGARPGKTRFRL